LSVVLGSAGRLHLQALSPLSDTDSDLLGRIVPFLERAKRCQIFLAKCEDNLMVASADMAITAGWGITFSPSLFQMHSSNN
jgi:hypothetical protein